MAKKLILNGIVQGVFCRNYCSQYARKLGVRGSATNQRDGTVRVILNTDDENMVNEYIYHLIHNPLGYTFYGRITDVKVENYSGTVSGDYMF